MSEIKNAILMHLKNRGGENSCAEYAREEVRLNITDEMQEEINEKAFDRVFNGEWRSVLSGGGTKSRGRLRQQEIMLGGLPCPLTLTFPCEEMPGGYSTVLFECARPPMLLLAAGVLQAKIEELKVKKEELYALHSIAVERAEHDSTMQLGHLTDDFEQAVG